MSMEICNKCDKPVDTDENVDGGYKETYFKPDENHPRGYYVDLYMCSTCIDEAGLAVDDDGIIYDPEDNEVAAPEDRSDDAHSINRENRQFRGDV